MPATPDFLNRHVGSIGTDRQSMLDTLGYSSLDALVKDIVPTDIQLQDELALNPALSEADALNQLRGIMSKNKLLKSYIGQGYYGTLTPSVVLRNILENPGWYTAYTPYQPEISQGRLEMLMNFQTMVSSLTGLPVTNASLLDEGTAAAEAMIMCIATKPKTDTFFVADTCHPQTIELIRTRSEPRGIKVITGDWQTFDPSTCSGLTGVLVQYPDTLGKISSYDTFFAKVHAAGALCIVAADLLALTMLREPATFGTDICIGNSQRFGVPMGFGGPHAGYMSVTEA
ncbi:MAG: glycine dehydrogenase (aminomethyl-transferring), partial [Akkermansia sp.]